MDAQKIADKIKENWPTFELKQRPGYFKDEIELYNFDKFNYFISIFINPIGEKEKECRIILTHKETITQQSKNNCSEDYINQSLLNLSVLGF